MARSRSLPLVGEYVPSAVAPTELELAFAHAVRDVFMNDGGAYALLEQLKRKDPKEFLRLLQPASDILQREIESAKGGEAQPHTRKVLSAVPKTALAAAAVPYSPPARVIAGEAE